MTILVRANPTLPRTPKVVVVGDSEGSDLGLVDSILGGKIFFQKVVDEVAVVRYIFSPFHYLSQSYICVIEMN